MRPRALLWRLMWLTGLLCALVGTGCGPAPPPQVAEPEPPREEAPAEPPGVRDLVMGGTVIRVADPEGRWRFAAEAQRAEASSEEGPFVLMTMQGRYESEGRPPVVMEAERATVDGAGERVVLEGRVRVRSQQWELEAARVEYDLRTGKVAAE